MRYFQKVGVPNQPLVVSGSACLDSADLSQG